MSLLTAVVVFLVGYVAGRVTLAIAGLAAIAALVLAVLGLAAPELLVEPLAAFLRAYYHGNELLFLSGFLFGVAHDRRTSKD